MSDTPVGARNGPLRDADAIAEDLRRRIPTRGVSFEFTTSSGPGGQNVNKVATRAVLRFDLAASLALHAWEKSRIREKLGRRVGADGLLQVSSMRFRSQAANRAAAYERFIELLAAALARPLPRKKTKAPRAAKARRLEEKRRVGAIKSSRRERGHHHD